MFIRIKKSVCCSAVNVEIQGRPKILTVGGAQMHDEPLTLGMMIVIAATSTLAAVGAAAIPSAGLVTMVMVLQAAGLDQYVADLSIIFTIDWALDRVRTVCNVMGDSFGAAIVQHVCYDTSYERASSSSPAVVSFCTPPLATVD